MVVIEVSRDGQKVGEHRFEQHDSILAGRSKDCHILIENDNFVSRHHLLMEIAPPEIRLRDFGSLNGTLVNGEKIGGREPDETPEEGTFRNYKEVDLRVGDEVKLGSTSLQIVEALKPKSDSSFDHLLGKSDAERIARFLFSVESKQSDLGNVGDYKIIKELGRGGFGVVFLGEDRKSRKQVAVKLMIVRGAVQEREIKNFEREIRNTASLSHPNIVQFQNYGHHEAMFYLVMEYCDGGDLAGLLTQRGRSMPINSLKRIMLDSLRGLAYAHSQGFVHRDLKPENLLLSNGAVKIGDFGLSKNFEGAGLSGFTLTGQTAGTPSFMPREQLVNFKYVDPTCDVWSIGGTFFFMLTGQTVYPFSEKRDPFEVILSEPPRQLSKVSKSVPKDLAKVIEKSLRVNPDERYRDAGDMLDAMTRVLG